MNTKKVKGQEYFGMSQVGRPEKSDVESLLLNSFSRNDHGSVTNLPSMLPDSGDIKVKKKEKNPT